MYSQSLTAFLVNSLIRINVDIFELAFQLCIDVRKAIDKMKELKKQVLMKYLFFVCMERYLGIGLYK